MATRGYHSYRGRSAGWKRLVIGLSVLALLAACVFMVAQRYITYTDDGGLRLDLPFLGREEPDDGGEPPPPEEDVNLVIDQPEAPEESEEPGAAAYGQHRLISLENLPAESREASLAQAGANGFVYTVRDNTGRVFYASQAALGDAVTAGAVAPEELERLCQREDLTAVARLNCFHDSYYAATHMESAGICQGTGYIWYDSLSYHWLDPDKEETRRYVISLALECAQMGFDELLLEEMSYPVSGKLEKIDYSGNARTKTEALALFLTELRQALEPYGVRLSLLVPEDVVLSGAEPVSGVDLAVLAPLVDAVYAATEDPAGAQAALAAAVGEDRCPAFVPVTAETDGRDSWYRGQ